MLLEPVTRRCGPHKPKSKQNGICCPLSAVLDSDGEATFRSKGLCALMDLTAGHDNFKLKRHMPMIYNIEASLTITPLAVPYILQRS